MTKVVEAEFEDYKTTYGRMKLNGSRIYRRTEESGGTSGAERAYFGDFPNIEIRPKFTFSKTDRIFTIGSCFARNIEKALVAADIRPIPVECRFPAGFYLNDHPTDWNGALNAYTPHSMLDLITLPDRENAMRAGALDVGEARWSELLCTGLRSLASTELDLVRQMLVRTYERIAEADVVILTLGLTESWYDSFDSIWVNKSPALERTAHRQPDRYKFCNITSTMATDALARIVSAIDEKTAGKARILLTTSPVPFAGTYTTRDVIVANAYSKATLLSAAVSTATSHSHVDYYPSYEMATMGPRADVWEYDQIHVKQAYVDKIIGRFLKHYLVD